MLLQLAAKKVKQLAFTFSGSNDKAIAVFETKRGWAAKKKKKKNYIKKIYSRYALITCDQGFFFDLLLGSMYARLARRVFYFRTCAYDAVFEGHRGNPSVFNAFFGICCLFYPFCISSMAALWEVNFRVRNERRRIYVTLGTGPF